MTTKEIESFRTVFIETQLAYADALLGESIGSTFEQASKFRRLDYKAPLPLPMEQAMLIMAACIESYNAFDSTIMAKLPTMFKSRNVIIAREGSPCIYILPGTQEFKRLFAQQDLIELQDVLHADECSIQDDGTLRIWWD